MKTLEPANLRLCFVPIPSLLVHEEDDPLRVRKLVRALERDGVLRNPPVVAEKGDHYIVLDGATRTSALKALGVHSTLVQLIDYPSESVRLRSWHHAIVGLKPNRLLANLSDEDAWIIQAVDSSTARQLLNKREIIACILMHNGQEFAVLCEGDIGYRAEQLCRLVGIYRGKAEVHRTTQVDLVTLARQYPFLAAVASFPSFLPEEVVTIAVNGHRLPMGITRHIIAGRALGLNIPLDRLGEAHSIRENNEWLDGKIREGLRNNRIRLYQEPVFVFDE